MRVSIDVYTTDVDAGLAAFKCALENGATDIRMSSVEDYSTQKFQCLNLMFNADHTSPAISTLDSGAFVLEPIEASDP